MINPDRNINPDDLNSVNVLNFNDFGLKVDENDFQDFISQSPFYDKCNIDIKDIKVSDNCFYITNKNSYMGAMLADYLRYCYLYSKETLFSFETVFSHSSKVDFLKNAKNYGWQVYLYFVSTADSYINYSRVEESVKWGS